MVIITDMTDFPQNIKFLISKVMTKGVLKTDNFRIHLLDCSLCQTFWGCLIYLFITKNLSILTVALTLFIAVNTINIQGILRNLSDLINSINVRINKIIRKL